MVRSWVRSPISASATKRVEIPSVSKPCMDKLFQIGGRLCNPVYSRGARRRPRMDDRSVRAALDRHWAASDAGDFEAEHDIYREEAVLDYPQSGERIAGRSNIQESRYLQPNKKRFTVRRITGAGALWITEFT